MKYHVSKMTNPDEYISQALGHNRFHENEIFPGYKNPMWKLHSVVPTGRANQLAEPLFWVIKYTEDRCLNEEEVQKQLDNLEKK